MKISVSGKGGSGKSTTTSLLALELKKRGYHPVIVDADESNSVIYRMLGLEKPPEPLVALAGGRKMVRQLMPPGYKPNQDRDGTHILTQARIGLDEIPAENIATKGNLSLIVIGKIVEALEGCACPMGVLGREFLGKLDLREKEIAITDMEAGIEHFGRGFESSLDRVLIIVEPSFESLSLAERIIHLSDGIGIKNVQAIINKVSSESVAKKLRDELARRGVSVIGSIPYDEQVFSADLEGQALELGNGKLAGALSDIVDTLLSTADSSQARIRGASNAVDVP
jgi:CO dehydrogenase maturation factor